jgi:hypothetical protein
MIQQIPKKFEGKGEVKGFRFKRVFEKDSAYLYKVTDGGSVWYEVFKRIASPVCIDFDKRIYSQTEMKESYPKSNQFGLYAWCCSSFDKALDRFNNIAPSLNNKIDT